MVEVWLTLFLPPLGLSSSQVEVEMLHSAGVKGDARPVCKTSRRADLPCLGGPITSIFSNLKGSAFRRCARRKARTDAGPGKSTDVHVWFQVQVCEMYTAGTKLNLKRFLPFTVRSCKWAKKPHSGGISFKHTTVLKLHILRKLLIEQSAGLNHETVLFWFFSFIMFNIKVQNIHQTVFSHLDQLLLVRFEEIWWCNFCKLWSRYQRRNGSFHPPSFFFN